MKYYMGNTGFLQPKNKLQKNVQLYLRLFNRKLISEQNIEDYKTEILATINSLNNENPKCTPLTPHWWSPGVHDDDGSLDWNLGGIDCATLNFKCSREVKL